MEAARATASNAQSEEVIHIRTEHGRAIALASIHWFEDRDEARLMEEVKKHIDHLTKEDLRGLCLGRHPVKAVREMAKKQRQRIRTASLRAI